MYAIVEQLSASPSSVLDRHGPWPSNHKQAYTSRQLEARMHSFLHTSRCQGRIEPWIDL